MRYFILLLALLAGCASHEEAMSFNEEEIRIMLREGGVFPMERHGVTYFVGEENAVNTVMEFRKKHPEK